MHHSHPTRGTSLRSFPLLLLLCGCAILQERNRRTLNALDAHLAPESTAARWAAFPVTLPAGVLGVAADAAVVHPCAVLDDAWGDTADWLWKPREESSLRAAVMAPLRAIATPLVFTGDWLARATFAIAPRKEDG